jgi:hypothetical protein
MHTKTTKRRLFRVLAVGLAAALTVCAACHPIGGADPDAGCVVVRQPPAGASTATLDTLLTPEHVELDGDTVVGVRMSTYVELIDAPDLPRRVSVKLGPSYFTECGDLHGAFLIHRAEVTSGDAVTFELTDDTTAAITALAGGSASVTLTGRYLAPIDVGDRCAERFLPGTEIPFTETVQVAVVEPKGARWETVVQPMRAAIGRRLENLSLTPVAADGHDINPINALPSRAIGIDAVVCDSEQQDWAPWDRAGVQHPLAAWTLAVQMPAEPGTITLRPAIGDALDIEVVDVSDVSKMELAFQVAGSVPLRLEDGESYGPSWARMSRFIFAVVERVEVDSTVLASDVPPEWFSLTTSPAEHCAPRDVEGIFGTVYGQVVADPIYVLADGDCTLELQAPERGVMERVRVSLANVGAMIDAP